MVPYLWVRYTQNVKTTVEISDELLREAKAHAALRGLSLRQVFEGSLRSYLENTSKETRYRLPDLSFGESGLRAGLEWEGLHRWAYEDPPTTANGKSDGDGS